jgi:tetratricopeptide (TPR) repeat protein
MRAAALALALGLLLSAAAPAAEPDLAAERTLLANITRRAFDDPDAMLAELDRQWPTDAAPAREASWLLARGRVLLAAGQADAADAVAVQLMSREDGADRSWLLRALIQERMGKPAGALAARALTGLDKRCPAGEEVRAVRELDCDFRSAWDALRLLHREQYAQGAFINAEASLRRALALVRAGKDKHLTALGQGMLAVVLQAQDHGDAARAEIRAALAEAQGDPVASARVRNFEGVVEHRAGSRDVARHALDTALQLAEQADAPHLTAILQSNLVDTQMRQGLLKEALATGQRALPVLQP